MTCRICGNAEDNEVYQAREMMYGFREVFDYFVCARCQTLQIAQVPGDLARFYPADYYSLEPPAREPFLLRAAKRLRNRYEVFGRGLIGRLLDRRAPNIYMRGLAIPGIRRDWRILDVGCGAGENTSALGDIGFRHVTGVDPYIERDIRYGNGVHIRRGTLHQMQGHWDLIYFHHSFEHVPDPVKTMRSAARLLGEGGYLVISTPVFPSAAWERYGTDWVALDAPRHLVIPSVPGMRRLAEQAGFCLQSVVYNGTDYQFWGSEQFRMGIPLRSEKSYLEDPAASPFTGAQVAAFRAEAERLNAEGRGDQAVFTLRRTAETFPEP